MNEQGLVCGLCNGTIASGNEVIYCCNFSIDPLAAEVASRPNEQRKKMRYLMSDLKPTGVKAPLNLLPLRPLRAISAAMQHGAMKYEPWNWTDNSQKQARVDELKAALLRHALASSDPTVSDKDDESGLDHLVHAGACILLLLYKLGIDYEPSLFVQNMSNKGELDQDPDDSAEIPGMKNE